MSKLAQQVIQINHYNLISSPDVFVSAIQALAKRVNSEGHPGVVGYQFFVNASEKTSGAVITYVSADAWMKHHQLAYQWEEMTNLQATVALKGMALFGPLNEEVEGFIANVKANFEFSHYPEQAAGFVRF